MDKLPKIVDPSTVMGRVTAEAASDCGLREGTPVAAGLGDTAAGALGAGIVRSGQLLDTAGTAAVLAGSASEFRPDTQERTLIVMRSAVEDQWISLAFLSGGSLLEWFHEAFYTDRENTFAPGFEELTAGIDEVPVGSKGLLFVPHLDGRLLPNDPAMRGAWAGMHRHHGRVHFVRAMLEGVAYEYAGYLRVLLDLHPELDLSEARVVGGGARSAAWNGIKASVLGVPYARLDREEFSCWGAALVAGHAVGVFDDLATAAERSTAVKERWEPAPEEHVAYQQMVEIYQELLGAVAGPSHKLARFNLENDEEA